MNRSSDHGGPEWPFPSTFPLSLFFTFFYFWLFNSAVHSKKQKAIVKNFCFFFFYSLSLLQWVIIFYKFSPSISSKPLPLLLFLSSSSKLVKIYPIPSSSSSYSFLSSSSLLPLELKTSVFHTLFQPLDFSPLYNYLNHTHHQPQILFLFLPKPNSSLLHRLISIVVNLFILPTDVMMNDWETTPMSSPVISEILLSGFTINSSLRRRTHLVQSFSVVFLHWFYVFSWTKSTSYSFKNNNIFLSTQQHSTRVFIFPLDQYITFNH